MLTKKFLKSKSVCKVTFEFPEADASKVCLVGEFNSWDETANPMRKVKGVWKTTLDLEQGREYQFRYLVNDNDWENDHGADKYVPNNVSGDNSVVVTYNN